MSTDTLKLGLDLVVNSSPNFHFHLQTGSLVSVAAWISLWKKVGISWQQPGNLPHSSFPHEMSLSGALKNSQTLKGSDWLLLPLSLGEIGGDWPPILT